MTTVAVRRPRPPFWLVVGGAVAGWLIAWFSTAQLATWLAFDLLRLEPGTQLGEAVAFFALDVPKVLLLLLGIVTAVTLLRGFFPPEKVRGVLAGRGEFAGTVGAASLGIVTPFCSCSAVPLFIGFVEAGVPLGVTFAFLISSPMVNEVALVLLWGLFGPVIAITYMAAGLAVAIVGGFLIGKLHMERYVEDYVWALQGAGGQMIEIRLSWEERVRDAWSYTRDLVGRILPYILLGIGIGAFIHGFVPTDLVVAIGGPGNPFAVPLVVLIAIPPLLERGRDDPHRPGPAREGDGARHDPRLHDGDHRDQPARVHHPQEGHQDPADRRLRDHRDGRDPVHRLPVQLPHPLGERNMRTIEVLGPGCNNCRRVEANAREAISMAGVEAEVVHVTDPREIVAHGILSTPGLVIDGRIRSYGRIPSAGDIAAWLSEPE
jgi:small redox-active disulfide protein 2